MEAWQGLLRIHREAGSVSSHVVCVCVGVSECVSFQVFILGQEVTWSTHCTNTACPTNRVINGGGVSCARRCGMCRGDYELFRPQHMW